MPVKQTLRITANAEAFDNTVAKISRPELYSAPILPQPGGFLNYDLSATRSTGANAVSGAFDAGFFSRYGALTSGFLAPTLNTSRTLTRLQTTYEIDYPDKLTSLRSGRHGQPGRDLGSAGPIRRDTVRHQFCDPARIHPYADGIDRRGQATLPSTVDVFVNNALVSRQTVPPGPFSITNIPIVSGTGEARLVVRDVLGREQVITQSFYGSATLLKEGLTDFSYELGVQRQNFGLASNDYGKGLASATYRKGVTDSFTAELHGEASGRHDRDRRLHGQPSGTG